MLAGLYFLFLQLFICCGWNTSFAPKYLNFLKHPIKITKLRLLCGFYQYPQLSFRYGYLCLIISWNSFLCFIIYIQILKFWVWISQNYYSDLSEQYLDFMMVICVSVILTLSAWFNWCVPSFHTLYGILWFDKWELYVYPLLFNELDPSVKPPWELRILWITQNNS